jgi:hypothetical protein
MAPVILLSFMNRFFTRLARASLSASVLTTFSSGSANPLTFTITQLPKVVLFAIAFGQALTRENSVLRHPGGINEAATKE